MSIFFENRANGVGVDKRQRLTFPPHLHDSPEVIYFTDGRCRCTVDFTDYELGAGDVLLAFPRQIHSFEALELPVVNYALFFPRTLTGYEKTLSEKQPECPALYGVGTPELTALFEAAYKARLAGSDGYESGRIAGYIGVIMGMLLPHCKMVEVLNTDPSIEQRFIEYCSAHFTENISLSDVATALGYSNSHLSHIISERFKMSFPGFIHALRVDEATKRLHNTNDTMTKIALDCGFGSVRNFNRVFFAEKKITPGAFRQKQLRR